MNVAVSAKLLARPGSAAAAPLQASAFWAVQLKNTTRAIGKRTVFDEVLPGKQPEKQRDKKRELSDLVSRVSGSPGIELFNAVEAGVPTRVVNMIAEATGEPVSAVIDLIGVSPTTFRRKEEAKECLPDVAGHRVMAYLRVVATLRKQIGRASCRERV